MSYEINITTVLQLSKSYIIIFSMVSSSLSCTIRPQLIISHHVVMSAEKTTGVKSPDHRVGPFTTITPFHEQYRRILCMPLPAFGAGVSMRYLIQNVRPLAGRTRNCPGLQFGSPSLLLYNSDVVVRHDPVANRGDVGLCASHPTRQ